VDDRGQGYWLAYAVNGLIGIVGGHPDIAAEERARELDRSAELINGPSPEPAAVPRPAASSGPVAADALVLAGDHDAKTPVEPPPDPRAGLQELLGWVLPGLLAGTSVLEGEAEQTEVPRVEARTPAGTIVVSAEGPDQARLARGDAGLVAINAVPTSRMAVPAGFAVAALIGAVLCFMLRVPVLGVLRAGVAVVPVVFALQALRHRRRGERALADDRAKTSEALEYAEQQAKSMEQARIEAVGDAHGLALAIREGAKILQPAADAA